jgi:DNA modification methylase
MAVIEQTHTERYSIYNGDCLAVMGEMPEKSIDLSIYSPPFCALYTYSNDLRDLSNSRDYDEFMAHYRLVVQEIARLTKPGRCTAVHAMDIPDSCNLGNFLSDFPGDIIRLHESLGFKYVARHHIWKEPLGVRNRTMAKGLAHKTVCMDSTLCDVAGADYLLIFRRDGKNVVPVTHERGLLTYYGEDQPPAEILHWRDFDGDQKQNKFSHYCWRRYASSSWHDIRLGNVLPYQEARDAEDEKHVHPLQLDVIARVVELRSNPNEIVFTPFLGVGSEVYQAVTMGRRGIGCELKPSYYRQAVKNCATAGEKRAQEEMPLFNQPQNDVDGEEME